MNQGERIRRMKGIKISSKPTHDEENELKKKHRIVVRHDGVITKEKGGTDENGEYFINTRGAKIYRDWEKNPMMEFKEINDVKEKGYIHEVLSLGILGDMKEKKGIITIEENGQAKCYRMPEELFGCVLMGIDGDRKEKITTGKAMFPCQMKFSLLNGRYCFNHVMTEQEILEAKRYR